MSDSAAKPLRIINSVAPIRICDNGGWTDTWFAEHGKIFNIGVYPYAEVQVEVYPLHAQEERILVDAENYGERFAVRPDKEGSDRHPLLEAAIERMEKEEAEVSSAPAPTQPTTRPTDKPAHVHH